MKKHKPDSKLSMQNGNDWAMCGRKLLFFKTKEEYSNSWKKITCKLCLIYKPKKVR